MPSMEWSEDLVFAFLSSRWATKTYKRDKLLAALLEQATPEEMQRIELRAKQMEE